MPSSPIDAARAYWESTFVRFYRDPALAERHREELAGLDGPQGLEIARRWASEHEALGDTADDLTLGGQHHELARLLREFIASRQT